ncbi:MAG: DUF1236 domain-containing protein [Pseudolabrys sp.]
MELGVQLSVCFYRAAVRPTVPVGYETRSPGEHIGGHRIGRVRCRSNTTDRPKDDSASVHPALSTKGYVIKENLKDMHIKQVPRRKEIGIGNKVPSDIGLHDFPPFVLEKVPKVKTYKFFITENQIVLVSPQNEIADIIK